MYNPPLVPDGLVVPESLETERVRLRPLTIHDAVKDFAAVMESEERLRAIFRVRLLELRVFAAESLLESLVSPSANAAGHVSDSMQQGGGGASLRLELIKWIGSAQSPGLLNRSPWNVPREAP